MSPDLPVEALWLLTGTAAFVAGVLNPIAGGGSFLTFPALVFAGVPPLAANATSAMAVSPGYLGRVLGFRSELQTLPRALLQREVAIAATGGLIGAGLLLVTPARVFSGLGPGCCCWPRRCLRPAPGSPGATRGRATPAGGCRA
jgi:uncharacterized membrane protein YfcA